MAAPGGPNWLGGEHSGDGVGRSRSSRGLGRACPGRGLGGRGRLRRSRDRRLGRGRRRRGHSRRRSCRRDGGRHVTQLQPGLHGRRRDGSGLRSRGCGGRGRRHRMRRHGGIDGRPRGVGGCRRRCGCERRCGRDRGRSGRRRREGRRVERRGWRRQGGRGGLGHRRGRGRHRGRRRGRRAGGSGSRRGGRARRQERERVDVPLRIGGAADAELHDGRVVGERTDGVSLGDRRASRRGDLTEVRERDRPAVGRLDRHRPPAPGDGAGEGDRPGRRRAHGRAGVAGDVDASVLAGGIGARRIERKGCDDAAVCGPCPGLGGRHDRKCDREREQESVHGNLVCPEGNVCSFHRRAGASSCQKRLQSCHKDSR